MNTLSCKPCFKNAGNSLELKYVYGAGWVLDCIKICKREWIVKQITPPPKNKTKQK